MNNSNRSQYLLDALKSIGSQPQGSPAGVGANLGAQGMMQMAQQRQASGQPGLLSQLFHQQPQGQGTIGLGMPGTAGAGMMPPPQMPPPGGMGLGAPGTAGAMQPQMGPMGGAPPMPGMQPPMQPRVPQQMPGGLPGLARMMPGQ